MRHRVVSVRQRGFLVNTYYSVHNATEMLHEIELGLHEFTIDIPLKEEFYIVRRLSDRDDEHNATDVYS